MAAAAERAGDRQLLSAFCAAAAMTRPRTRAADRSLTSCGVLRPTRGADQGRARPRPARLRRPSPRRGSRAHRPVPQTRGGAAHAQLEHPALAPCHRSACASRRTTQAQCPTRRPQRGRADAHVPDHRPPRPRCSNRRPRPARGPALGIQLAKPLHCSGPLGAVAEDIKDARFAHTTVCGVVHLKLLHVACPRQGNECVVCSTRRCAPAPAAPLGPSRAE